VREPPRPLREPGQAPPFGEDDYLDSTWEPVDLFADTSELPTPTLGGIAYPETRHHLSGEPEGLKTWLVLILAAELIEQEKHVIYIDLENGPRAMLERLRSLRIPDENAREYLSYINPSEPATTPGARNDIRKLLELEPALAVIDSMAGALALHDLDPNSGRDVELFNRLLVDPLRSEGAATFLLDHVTKSRDTRSSYAIGSERKVGAADVHLGLEKIAPFGRGQTGRAKLIVHKDRLGWLPRPNLAELVLISNDDGTITYRVDVNENGDAKPFRPTTLMERVSRYLESQELPSTKNAIDGAVNGRREWVLRAIDALVVDGHVTESEGTRGARLFASARPYRELDETPYDGTDEDDFPF
jgi:hypothetical protein